MSRVIEREDLPVVVVNLLTKNRTELAVRTIHACLRHLKYDGKLMWFVTDNGSEVAHVAKVKETIPNVYWMNGYVGNSTIGDCWNKGLMTIFNQTEFYIRLEDDMVLKADLDITRYVKMMCKFPQIGMVRLGQMVIDLEFISEKFRIDTHIGFEEDVLLMVEKTMPYCFSGHPAIVHKRFHEVYGYYADGDQSAGELEVAMDKKVRGIKGPGIYFPWDLGIFGTWGAWDHVGVVKA